jgi:hypothetical protein
MMHSFLPFAQGKSSTWLDPELSTFDSFGSEEEGETPGVLFWGGVALDASGGAIEPPLREESERENHPVSHG